MAYKMKRGVRPPFKMMGSSPYKENAELERKSYTFGLGVDRGHFIVDFSYVLSEGSDEHFMYSADLIAPATVVSTTHHFLFTLGLRY